MTGPAGEDLAARLDRLADEMEACNVALGRPAGEIWFGDMARYHAKKLRGES